MSVCDRCMYVQSVKQCLTEGEATYLLMMGNMCGGEHVHVGSCTEEETEEEGVEGGGAGGHKDGSLCCELYQ